MIKDSIIHRVQQNFPSFEKTAALGMPQIYAFDQRPCEQWYTEGMAPLFDALGQNKHFPVFRISHGELHLALGRRVRPDATPKQLVAHYYHKAKQLLRLEHPHREGPTVNGTWELFSYAELEAARARYIPALRNIANEGLLAACFQTNAGYVEYFPDYFDWLDRHDIPFNRDNYVPFYSVYSMAFGPDSAKIFQGRRILIVNYLPEEKQQCLREAMAERGVESVQFISIRPDKALFQDLDLSSIDGDIDVVLLGAGCGAAPMTEQLKPLNAVVIDGGFVIDALAKPEARWRRAFCIPDNEFVPEQVNFPIFG
ncbi:MAG: hypothetical protein ACON39_01795 [Coraliomargaritaceae bacterium]